MSRPLRINSFVINQPPGCRPRHDNIKSSSNRVAMSLADVEEKEGTDAGKCFGKCAERGRGRDAYGSVRDRRARTLLFAPFTNKL